MKTKDELKIGDVVWVNFNVIEKNIESYSEISKPTAVIVEKLNESLVLLKPTDKKSMVGKITSCNRNHYIFYESYEEALTDLIIEATDIINDLRNLANKIEKDVISLKQ